MNKIKILFVFFTIIFLSGCSDEPEEEQAKLIGKWQSVSRQSNMGTTIMFRPDSSIGMDSDIFFTFQYKFDGENLISYSKNPGTGKMVIDTNTVSFEEDKRMIFNRVNEGSERTTILTRESKGDGSKITGKWSWVHPSGKLAETEYFKDGTATAYILLKASEGKYNVRNDTLTITFPGTKMPEIIFRVSSDTLYFNSYDGSLEYAYRKID